MKLENIKQNEYYIQYVRYNSNLCIDFIKPKLELHHKIKIDNFTPEYFRELSNIDK